MNYGHVSWIPIVVLGGTFLIRYLSSQRRRSGPPAGPGQRRFTGTEPRPGSRPAPPAEARGAGATTGGMPAGWFRDPFVRHEQRYWSGAEWTDHVLDDDVPGTDAPPAPPGPGGPD